MAVNHPSYLSQQSDPPQIGTKSYPYDIIISGAGPAGLAAGIVGGRHRLNILICEKAASASPFPRGETLHNAQIFTEVLGDNVLNLIAMHLTAARKFNSPNAENSLEIYRQSPSIVYEWSKFIHLLLSRIEETSTTIRYNNEVMAPIIENGVCTGVVLGDNSRVYAKNVLVCDGHSSLVGRSLQVPYPQINCLMIKRLITNFAEEYMGFEYFFLVPGMLSYAPRFPPAVIFLFPRGKRKCEVGMMIFTDLALKLSSICDIPSEEEHLRVWHQLIETYPRFSTIMANTAVDFEGQTFIASAKVFDNPMPVPGLFLTGGAMGFVEHSGSSGIASSMQIAKFAVDYVHLHPNLLWNKNTAKSYVKAVRGTKFYKHILNNAKKTAAAKDLLFLKLKTAENLNDKWGLVKAFYKLS